MLIKITYRHWDQFAQKSRNAAIPERAIFLNFRNNYFSDIICD